MSIRGNSRWEKCQIGEELVGELSSRGCVGRGNVQLGNCPRIMAKYMETYMHCNRAPKNTPTDTEFTIVEHGRKKLKKGYLYILQKKLTNDCTSWEYVLRRKEHYEATYSLIQIIILLNRNAHTHPPSQANCQVPNVRAGIRRPAMETVMTKQQILA